jgi:hypothetical protein
MTDTDRIDHESDGNPAALDDALEEWDEYTDDEGVYKDFLDWLNIQT